MQALQKNQVSKDVQMGRTVQKQTLHGLWRMVRVLSDAIRSPYTFREKVSNQLAWRTEQNQFIQRNQEVRRSMCELSLLTNSEATQ
jgi:hypothetical protein